VIAGDAVGPEPVQEVGVVGVAEEGLGIGPERLRIQMPQHGDLVVAADGGEHGPDARIGVGGHEVGGPFGGRRVAAGGGVFDRLQIEDLAEAPQALLVHGGEVGRGGVGRRDDGDPVAGSELGRSAEIRTHTSIEVRGGRGFLF
jgi:hypothetical protein